MQRRSISILVPAVAVLALLVAVAPALARKPGVRFVTKPRVTFAFNARAGNGYRLEVSSAGDQKVDLSVSKGDGFADYTVPGRYMPDGVRANFGRLGRIAVTFKALHEKTRPEKRCKGRDPVTRHGVFRGTIRFHGEGGFTKLDAKHASGEVEQGFREACRGVPPRLARQGKAPAFEGSGLEVESSSHGRTVELETFKIRIGSERFSNVAAILVERVGRIEIFRASFEPESESTVEFSPLGSHPATATVAPRLPFQGSATYQEVPGASPSWTGTLTASLPGAEGVPLTGPGFRSRFCQAKSLHRFETCTAVREAGGASGSRVPRPARQIARRLGWRELP